MTPAGKQALDKWMADNNATEVSAKFTDGSTITVTAPVTPPTPTNVVMVGPSYAHKSLDDVTWAAKTFYWLERGATIKLKERQTINVPQVVIMSEPGTSAPAILDCDAKWKENQLSFTAKATECAVRDVTIQGHDGATLLAITLAPLFTIENVIQRQHPIHKGGVGIVNCNTSQALSIRSCTTERTARYGVYLGDSGKSGNKNFKMSDCEYGPCAVTEDPKSSGLTDYIKTHPGDLHGGGFSEHNFRAYSAIGMQVDRCKFHNPNNKDGKQAVKIMSGDGVSFSDCLFDGSTRFGRDKNDQDQTAKLRNVILDRCTFAEWVRIDPGAGVTISNSTATAHSSGVVFNMAGGALFITAVAATYQGGKLTNDTKALKVGNNVTFNGQSVPTN